MVPLTGSYDSAAFEVTVRPRTRSNVSCKKMKVTVMFTLLFSPCQHYHVNYSTDVSCSGKLNLPCYPTL